MSVLVRVVCQFREDAETIALEKVLVLPEVPTMGARLDLRTEGVETALNVVDVTLRPVPDGPGLRPPGVEVLEAEIARSSTPAELRAIRTSQPS